MCLWREGVKWKAWDWAVKVMIQSKKSVLKNSGHLYLGILEKLNHNPKGFTQLSVCGIYVSGGNTEKQSA